MTTEQFDAIVANWLATAKDGRFKRFYTSPPNGTTTGACQGFVVRFIHPRGKRRIIVGFWTKLACDDSLNEGLATDYRSRRYGCVLRGG